MAGRPGVQTADTLDTSDLEILTLRKQGVPYTSLAVVLLVAFAMRLHGIDDPLWLDELFGLRVARLRIDAIIQNSWTDPHPPLYYLMQWVVSRFCYTQSEIVWRWTSLSSGVLALAVTGITVRKITDSFSSVMVCLIAATLPSLVFYSQEARPYSFLVLLASLSMWLTTNLLRNACVGKWLWIGWTITNLLGLFTGYAYLMIAGMQVAYLGVRYHRHIAWRLASLVVVAGLWALLPFMASSLVRTASYHVSSESLTFWRALQTLFAGEPIRYGFSLSHTAFPLTVLALCVVTGRKAVGPDDNGLAYFFAQVVLPIGTFFGLCPLLGIRLPVQEAGQFIILMPAFLVLIASGLLVLRQRLPHRIGPLLAIAVCGALVLLNAIGLYSYWTNPKSPEGLAILGLRDRLQPGESVVSLHHSLNYALGFYTSGIPTYLHPAKDGDGYRYQLTTSEHIFDPPSTPLIWKETAHIRASGDFWVLAHSTENREPMASLVAGCQTVERETFSARNGSFELLKVGCLEHR